MMGGKIMGWQQGLIGIRATPLGSWAHPAWCMGTPELASRGGESSRFRVVGAPFQRIGDPESLFTPLLG